MKVVVLGAGALGTLYGAWFAEHGHDVVLVGRPAHMAAVAADGLAIRELDGTTRVVRVGTATSPAQDGLADADIVLLASKAQDSAGLLDATDISAPVAAFSVQNGVGQARPLVDRFGPAAVGAVSMTGATLVGPGVVQHTFVGSTYVGALPTSKPGGPDTIWSALDGVADVVVRDDIADVLWSKAVLAAAAMGASVLLRLPYHHVFVEPGARRLFDAIARDAAAIAEAEGASLLDLPGPLQAGSLMAVTTDEAVARLAAVGDVMVAAGQTSVRVSMLQSLDSGRRLEVDAVFGALIGVADEHHLEVPVLRAIHHVVATLDDVAARGGTPP